VPVPAQYSVPPLDEMLTDGVALLALTLTWAVAEHPLPSVTITVYVVSAVRPITCGFDVVVDDNATDGDHT
jgi:hypothetical protein